jgi:hypothetical protein
MKRLKQVGMKSLVPSHSLSFTMAGNAMELFSILRKKRYESLQVLYISAVFIDAIFTAA